MRSNRHQYLNCLVNYFVGLLFLNPFLLEINMFLRILFIQNLFFQAEQDKLGSLLNLGLHHI